MPDERREIKYEYRRPEIRPFPVKCDMHTWMSAYWLVLDHPYAAVSDADGRFKIIDLPAGRYDFMVWHERAGLIRRDLKVNVTADQTTEIGTISVAAEKFDVRARGASK